MVASTLIITNFDNVPPRHCKKKKMNTFYFKGDQNSRVHNTFSFKEHQLFRF